MTGQMERKWRVNHVTFRSTTALTSIFLPFEWVDEILKLAIDRLAQLINDPAMLDTEHIC